MRYFEWELEILKINCNNIVSVFNISESVIVLYNAAALLLASIYDAQVKIICILFKRWTTRIQKMEKLQLG